MMLPSHLLSVLALGLVFGMIRGRPFRGEEWLLALAFGVVIDLDHLLALPGFVLAHGAISANPVVMLHYGSAWQGFMHTPWALALVVSAMWWWRSAWPAVFWGLHMVEDFVVARHFVEWGSLMEWGIVAALAAFVWGLLAVQSARRRAREVARYAVAGAVFRR